MRHPALTRFFAAFLAVVSAITLLSGGICVKKARDDRAKRDRDLKLLDDRRSEAVELDGELERMREQYETLDADHEQLNADHAAEMIAFRKDLAIYTATEAGLKQGAEQLEEGQKGLNKGWVAYYKGVEALEEAEEQFRPGYEQFLAGKAALAQSWQKYYLAEEFLNSGVDIEEMMTMIEAGSTASRSLSASMGDLEDTLNNPPVDPETEEVDRDALAAQMAEQSSAILAELDANEELNEGAQAAFNSLSRFVEANGATLQDLLAEGYSAEEVQGNIAQQGAELQAQMNSMEQLAGELDGFDSNLSELRANLETVRDGAEEISQGELSDSEEVATLAEMLGSTRVVLDDSAVMLDGVGELMTMLQDLPAMREQLESAQAALDESEPMLLAAKAGFAESWEKMAEAELTLINAGAELEKGRQALQEKHDEQLETRAELERRKAEMEANSKTLAEQEEKLAAYSEKKDRFNNLRYALQANKGIAARMRDGETLLDAAEAEIAAERADTEREYRFRMAAAGLMLLGALLGVVTVVLVFRDKPGAALILAALLAAVLAAAAEGVSYTAGRGMIYTVLFVGIFALSILALNLKKA